MGIRFAWDEEKAGSIPAFRTGVIMLKKFARVISTTLGAITVYRFVKENWPVIREALDKMKSKRLK